MLLAARASALALPLADGSVQLVCGSPPYWSLRDYQGIRTAWPAVRYSPMPGLPPLDVEPMECQLGHEGTPEAFIGHLVACYREARRVLHETGTLWVNIGDTMAGGKIGNGSRGWGDPGWSDAQSRTACGEIQAGNALGIPWRLAFAMQADGWVLRSATIWNKPNPMPESVRGWRWERCRVKVSPAPAGKRNGDQPGAPARRERVYDPVIGGQSYSASTSWNDCHGCPKCEPHGGLVLRRGSWRPTSSYEMVFMFAKSAGYWADGEPVREAATSTPRPETSRIKGSTKQRELGQQMGASNLGINNVDPAGRNLRDVWTIRTEEAKGIAAALLAGVVPSPILDAALAWEAENEGNLADVWMIATRPNPLAHFAAFPEDLVRPIILSSTPDRCCSACGMPWSPVVEREAVLGCPRSRPGRGEQPSLRAAPGQPQQGSRYAESAVLGHRPSCTCDAPHRPARVLDQFGGTGTTARVARSLGRTAITLDAELGYCVMARDRAGEACIVAREERPRTLKTIEGPLFGDP